MLKGQEILGERMKLAFTSSLVALVYVLVLGHSHEGFGGDECHELMAVADVRIIWRPFTQALTSIVFLLDNATGPSTLPSNHQV